MRTNEIDSEWNEVYKSASTPWDLSAPDVLIVSMVERRELKPCRILDMGCGTGNEAVYLASRGFRVTGVDIAPKAIAAARKKMKHLGDMCTFILADVARPIHFENQFDVVIDRACFHFIAPDQHEMYLDNVSSALRQGGLFILYVASDRDHETIGPWKYSKEQIRRIFGGRFRILKVQLVRLQPHTLRPKVYFCLMKNDLERTTQIHRPSRHA